MVCIGYLTHKVLKDEIITKDDEPSAQHHETLGTNIIYEHLQSENVPIAAHAHDRNASVNKYSREEHPSSSRVGQPPDRFECAVNSDCAIAL